MSYKISERCNGCTLCARNCPVSAISGKIKEKHTIDTEKCIDCGVCGKVCPIGAIEDTNGNACNRVPREKWERPQFDYALCVACTACETDCPTGCIDMAQNNDADPKTPYPVLVKPEGCIGCGLCQHICPAGAIIMEEPAPDSNR